MGVATTGYAKPHLEEEFFNARSARTNGDAGGELSEGEGEWGRVAREAQAQRSGHGGGVERGAQGGRGEQRVSTATEFASPMAARCCQKN